MVHGASASPAGREFEIAYVDAESGARRLALIDAWSVPFEECMPVRGFPSYKGQRNHVGRWWTATTGSLVGYESWLERDWLMLLDFDPDVVGIAAQPFWLLWTTPHDGPGRPASTVTGRNHGRHQQGRRWRRQRWYMGASLPASRPFGWLLGRECPAQPSLMPT